MELRPYQQKAIDDITSSFRRGYRKVLLHLATGGGKTHCFSYMMTKCRDNGMRSIMVVRGRQLVEQASRRLWAEDVTHGVWMAGHWNYRPQAPVQVCSIDTLHARGVYPPADLIVIDEAHMATSAAYKELVAKYPNAFIVGVTATPYVKKGLRHICDTVVHPITMCELVEQGFLVAPRYFAPPGADISGVKVSRSTGDYQQDELAMAMDKPKITGDIVAHWQRLGQDRPTLCFAVSVVHSRHLTEQFLAAGIPAEHCDANTPDDVRDILLKRLQLGEIKVLTNVGIMGVGVDAPFVSCLIMARPTRSYNLYIQQAGRATRVWPGKTDFILLDHAGNVNVHGRIDDEPEANIDGNNMSKRSAASGLRTCMKCYAVYDSGMGVCPACGQANHKPRAVEQVEGNLQEIAPPTVKPLEKLRAEEECETWVMQAVAQNFSVWRAYYQTRDKYGEEIAKLVFFRVCKRLHVSPPRSNARHNAGGRG